MVDKEERRQVYRALMVPAYLEGVQKTIKHWERWRMQPKDVLIAHVKKLAEECADRRMEEVDSKEDPDKP
jgi:hypothetical protein